MKDFVEILVQCPIFAGLSIEALEEELLAITYKIQDYPAKEIIAMSDDECRNLYVVLEGKVRGEMTDFSGKVIRIEELDRGMPLAPAFIFGKQNRYPVDIVTVEKTVIISIPKLSLLQLFQNNSTILNNYLGLISNRAQFLTSRIRFLSFQTIKGKIAHYLLQSSRKAGADSFELKSSHNELAEIFGVTRPSLSRALRDLNNDNIIIADGKRITLIDKQKLQSLIQ